MRTLIYKRTHPGDPDDRGLFGIEDCMGSVRKWPFDAVIGVGGIGSEPRSHGLDGKVNWIGIGPHHYAAGGRGPILKFDHFVLYESKGPDFERLAPLLAARIYSTNVRVLMDDLDEGERGEVDRILRRAKKAPPSRARASRRSPTSSRGVAQGLFVVTSRGSCRSNQCMNRAGSKRVGRTALRCR